MVSFKNSFKDQTIGAAHIKDIILPNRTGTDKNKHPTKTITLCTMYNDSILSDPVHLHKPHPETHQTNSS